MSTMTTQTRIAGIVAELERLLVDRQTLVHSVEALSASGHNRAWENTAPSRGALSEQLERIIAQQTRLLDELTVLHPPAGRPEA